MRDLSAKVTLLEEEKEKTSENTKNLVRSVKEKLAVLEEKEKEWVERGEEVTRLKVDVTLLRSREVNQGAFAKLVAEKVLRTVDDVNSDSIQHYSIQEDKDLTYDGSNEVWSLNDTRSTKGTKSPNLSGDLLHGLGGPTTRIRAKKMKEVLNSLIHEAQHKE